MRPLVLLCILALGACKPHVPSARWFTAPLFVRTDVQPGDLAGRWYEVGHFPAPFERGCTHGTADYSPRPDGTIGVVNRCRKGGVIHEARGHAWVKGPGRLGVDLRGAPIDGDLWVLGLSQDRRTLVLGTPTRIGGWVLHRDTRIDPREFRAARDLFERSGYDAGSLQKMDQR